MYKRFTEKRNGKNAIPLLNSVCGVDLPKWTIAEESDIRRYLSGDAVDKLAELEDKIENGTLIELPCKVGDTVYLPWVYGGVCSIAYLTVTNIILDTKKSYIRTDFETDSEDYWEKYKGGQYDFSDFGKIIFTNKAEAEAKLKER